MITGIVCPESVISPPSTSPLLDRFKTWNSSRSILLHTSGHKVSHWALVTVRELIFDQFLGNLVHLKKLPLHSPKRSLPKYRSSPPIRFRNSLRSDSLIGFRLGIVPPASRFHARSKSVSVANGAALWARRYRSRARIPRRTE